MGMDPVTLGMAGSAIGGIGSTIINGRNQAKQAKAQNQYMQGIRNQAQGMMWQDTGPNAYSGALQGLLSGANRTMNIGQDGLMQSLNGNGGAGGPLAFYNTMMQNGGNPFDTSQMFKTLGVVDQRNMADARNTMSAGASGIGSRFGTSMQHTQANMLARMTQDLNARNAGIQQSSYESGMGRAMEAAQGYGSTLMGAAQMGSGLEAQRRNYNLQLLQLQAGMMPQQAGMPDYGSNVTDMSQFAMMAPFFRSVMGGKKG